MAGEFPVAEQGLYLYAITDAGDDYPIDCAPIGENGGQVMVLAWKDIGTVVSPSPIVRYEPFRKNFLAHQLVIEEVMDRHTVLPVRFGSVAPGAGSVCQIMQERYDEFAGALARFKDKVEHGVKATWEDGMAFAEILAENSDIRSLRDKLAKLPPEKTWNERRHLGQMVEQALLAKREREAAIMLKSLTPFCVEHQTNATYWDQMILNAVFLVQEARTAELDEAMDALSDQYEGRAKFSYVGPVAPFNFIEITVQLPA